MGWAALPAGCTPEGQNACLAEARAAVHAHHLEGSCSCVASWLRSPRSCPAHPAWGKVLSKQHTMHELGAEAEDLDLPEWQGGDYPCLRRMQHTLVKQGWGFRALHSGLCTLIWRQLVSRAGRRR